LGIIRNITALAAALTVTFTLCGCSSEKPVTGEDASAVSAAPDSSRKTYETFLYRFTADEGLTQTDSYQADNGGIREYEFAGMGFTELSVRADSSQHLRAKAAARHKAGILGEDTTKEDIETEDIGEAPYECAAYHYTDILEDEKEGQCFSVYQMTYQSTALEVKAHYKKEDAEKVRAEMRSIICSGEYTGDFFLPTGPQDYDTPYLSLHHDPKWMARLNREPDPASGRLLSATFAYAETDDPMQDIYPALVLRVFDNGGTMTAGEYAESEYEENSGSDLYDGIRLTSGEFMGNEASIITYDIEEKALDLSVTGYYFDLNGMIYIVETKTHIGSERDQKDMEELLSGLTLK